MNQRLQEIIKYKTGGGKGAFAALLNWSPQYLTKLLKGENFGLQPVMAIITALPELNARWFLTGEGDMLNEDHRTDVRREALEHVQRIMDYERLIPVMNPEELRQFEEILLSRDMANFSPDTLIKLNERADERIKEINAKFAAANAKSDELCKQRTAKKS